MKTCGCSISRIVEINAKCDDRCIVSIGGKEEMGYVPYDLGLGGGDYVRFSYCLGCGLIQGDFPRKTTDLESK